MCLKSDISNPRVNSEKEYTYGAYGFSRVSIIAKMDRRTSAPPKTNKTKTQTRIRFLSHWPSSLAFWDFHRILFAQTGALVSWSQAGQQTYDDSHQIEKKLASHQALSFDPKDIDFERGWAPHVSHPPSSPQRSPMIPKIRKHVSRYLLD